MFMSGSDMLVYYCVARCLSNMCSQQVNYQTIETKIEKKIFMWSQFTILRSATIFKKIIFAAFFVIENNDLVKICSDGNWYIWWRMWSMNRV
jgi:hypothetical protein